MIDFLLRARRVSIAAVALLLVALLVADKRVSYEQSIKSFFADDDPAMVDYQQGLGGLRRRQLRLRRLRRPRPAHPRRDGPGGRAGRARSARRRSTGVPRVESLDAMPLLWKVDDGLIAMDATARRSPGTCAQTAMREAIKNVNLDRQQRPDRRRRRPVGRRRRDWPTSRPG